MRVILKLTLVSSFFLAAACSGSENVSYTLEAQFEQDSSPRVALIASPTADRGHILVSLDPEQAEPRLCRGSGSECSQEGAPVIALQRLERQPNTSVVIYRSKQVISFAEESFEIHSDTSLLRRFKIARVQGDLQQQQDPLKAGLAKINREQMQQELTHISDDKFAGRLSTTPGHEKAAEYIESQLRELGIRPLRGESYRQEFTLRRGPRGAVGKKTFNVIGKIEGNDPDLKERYLVIGAHLDHTGTLQFGWTCSRGASGSNQICNGADDNGSGSIAVLNVAKALAAIRGELRRSVIVMWFSGEEEGLLGSNHFVNSDPLVPVSSIDYMINMDMVGYLRQNNNVLGALGGGTSSEAAAILRSLKVGDQQRRLNVTARAGGGSDHVAFMARGIPGVFLHTGVRSNANYHRTSDTADKIDYDGLVYATKVAFELILRMANRNPSGLSLVDYENREPLVSETEIAQSCKHLIHHPFNSDIPPIDFTYMTIEEMRVK